MYDFTKQYEARILIKGKPVTEYHHVDGNIYVEGRKGSEYELEFYNNSAERICIIPAVDGLSVMDGEAAGINSDGYIVQPYSTIQIPGWRLDNSEVAKFEFSSKTQSYAKKSSNDTSNTGVIGFMVFREEIQNLSPFPIARNYSGNMGSAGGFAGSLRDAKVTSSICNTASTESDDMIAGATLEASSARSLTSDVGTAFGDAAGFKTYNVDFNKRDANNPDAVLVLYYDSIKGLEKRGIHVKKKYNKGAPDPFPMYTSTNTGCTPPKGWRG